METTTTVNIIPIDEPDALFCHYQSESNIQSTHLYLNLETGAFGADYNAGIGSSPGIPAEVYHHRTLWIDIPCLTAEAANRLLADAAETAQQIIDGATVDRDGSNNVGQLDAEATAAYEELAGMCAAENFGTGDQVLEWDAHDWFGGEGTEQTITRTGLTADTTDEQIVTIAEAERVEAATVSSDFGYVVLVGAGRFLSDLRDELRDRVRDELQEVAARHAELETKRNEMIVKLSGWGDSSREIAARVGLSHTQVQNIAKRTE